mmetsp:Transcript_23831/g.36254  ORF Transcript_23831/g.36254 Transcript_23831/m.36254 type:complete len:118 (-) Transcript_23831:865-1218(-)
MDSDETDITEISFVETPDFVITDTSKSCLFAAFEDFEKGDFVEFSKIFGLVGACIEETLAEEEGFWGSRESADMASLSERFCFFGICPSCERTATSSNLDDVSEILDVEGFAGVSAT